MRHLSTRSAFGNHAITLLYINQDNIKIDRTEVGINWLRTVTTGGPWHRRNENFQYAFYSVNLHKSFQDAEAI